MKKRGQRLVDILSIMVHYIVPQSTPTDFRSMWLEKLIAPLCCVTITFVLIATLWPLDFFRPNGAHWLPEGNGIRFSGPGVVLGDGPLKAGGAESSNSCALEIFLRPTGIESLRTILSFYVPSNARQLMVRQLTDGLLILHDFVDTDNRLKTGKIAVEHIFQPGKLVLVTIVSGPIGTVIYMNGNQRQATSDFTVVPKHLAGQIVLGTSPVRYDPWLGEIHGIAVYSKELTPAEVLRHYNQWVDEHGAGPPNLSGAIARYDFTEGTGHKIRNAVSSGPDLEIPKGFAVPHKPFLQFPLKQLRSNRLYLQDILQNIAGFVPVGFLVCLYWGKTRNPKLAILYAILAGGALSFLIEVLQAYVPQRDSGVTDIATNTLGTALGAVLARPSAVWRRQHSERFESDS